MDSLSFKTSYLDDQIEFISFQLFYQLHNDNKQLIKTRDYIDFLNDREEVQRKIVIPNGFSSSSIQEELYFSPVSVYDSIWLQQSSLNQGHYMVKFNDEYLKLNLDSDINYHSIPSIWNIAHSE